MAASTDLVASRAAALRLAQQMGCSGAHQHPDGKWMPCATMEEYEELVKKDKKNTVRVVEQRRRYRNSKGKNKRDWEPLTERGITSIDTIAGGGLVSGSVKAAPWAPDEEDPDVFTTPRLARRRSRQLGCIGVSRRVSRNGNIVWTPCSNMTDYAKRTGSTAFGRNYQRRRAQRTLERAVSREVRRQLRRKKSLMEELYEGKALGRKLNRARVAATTPFNRDARDADMDMLVQEGTPWERPATPRVPGLRSRRGIAAQVDPALVPEDPVGESREKLDHLMDLAGYAQMQKLRRANPDVPDDKLYRLAREVDLGEGRSETWSWGNDSKIPAEMENLPDETLDRITREALAEFDRRKEVERLRVEVDPVTHHPLRVEGLTDREIKAQIGLQQMDRDRLEQGLPSRYRRPFYDSDYLNRLIAERTAREKRGDWMDSDLPAGFASSRSGRRRAERAADRLQRRRNLDRDRQQFEMDMADPRVNPRTTETDIDEMAEYYDFAEAVGGFQSVRGFKLTPEDSSLSGADKAAKYRKATLDAVGEEHRGKPVRRVHWVYGAPGSGKTAKTRLGHLLVPDESEAAHTNPDDYKRFHKLWNFGEGSGAAHQFSREESRKTLHEALKEGMDVVVQGTGKDGLLMNQSIFEDGDYKKGRRGDTASVMHYLHVSDDERSRRIFDRGRRDTPATGQDRRDQRKRYGAEPHDAMNVLDQVVKYIEEGRVDEAHIYDNSGPLDETPPLVATFKDGNLVIYDEDKFNEIFDPKDPDGQPTVFRGRVADRPRVTAYSDRDDPRVGKTYAERLREEGENPGGFRKWDEARREKTIRERKQPKVERASGDTASYRGMHTAPTKSEEGGDTLDNLTNMLPLQAGENNNDRVRLYGSSGSDPEYRRANGEMEAVFDAVAGKPDEMITVYRAVPSSRDASQNDQINPGDWVSPSPTYAAIHGEGPLRGEYDIVETRVRAGDLVSEGNSLYEFGWDPEPDPVHLSYYTALDGLTEEEAEAVVDLLGPRGFRSHRNDVRNSKDSRSIERRGGKTASNTLKKGNDDYDRMVKVGYVFEPITGTRGHSGGVFPPDRVLGSIRGWALEQGLRVANLEPHPRTPLDGTVLPPFIPEEVVKKVIEKIYRNYYDPIGDQHRIKREGFDSFVRKLEARQLQRTVEAGEDTIDWDAMVPLKPDEIVLINDEHWEAITEVLKKDYDITPDLDYMQDYGQRNNNPSAIKAGGKDDAHHNTLKWLREHLAGSPRGVFRDERANGKPIRTVIDAKIIEEDMKRIADGEPGWLGAVPPSKETQGARLNDYTKSGYERNRDSDRPRMLYSFGQGDVDGVEHNFGRITQTEQQEELNTYLEDLDVLAEMFDEAGISSPATQDLLDRLTGSTKKALSQAHEGPLSKERIKQIETDLAEVWKIAIQDDDSGGSGGLASRRDDDGENLQDAYRRHLKAQGIQTDGERAFEEQYGYELRSGDGDCYSASYRAAAELVEKGVDVDGDPVTNVRVVVGSPMFPKVGERSGHAWVEYDAVKPPPPLMSSADRDHAKEQILVLVEGMDLPPKRKQDTIDSFLDAIDRANEANAAAPVRDVTMVRDYSNVKDGDDVLEFDDMDRGRLEALKPDMERDVYYRAGEMEEVDIAGRFSPAEYEETQVGLFGSDFYDGDATFLTREQVDQHLEDMGIDGGFESKRTDDADAEDERLHNEAIGQLREIFTEAGAEQSDTILDQLAYEMRSSPRGMMGGRDAPIKPDYLEAIRELVEERDPEFMEDLAETLRIRQTTEGYRRLTESGLDSGVGVHNQETSPIRGIFDGHIKDGDPITLYHGGPVDLTGDVDYEVSRNDSGQWGPGIYTTASAFPAIKGWANPWQRNAEGGYDTVDPGHLHTTRWKGENPPQILDVMDPLPDDVLDGVAIPAIESLLREIKKSSQAERRDNWKIKYLEEELEATLDFIDRKRGEVTGPETLLQIQKYMQEGDVAYGRGELDGFLPSDRLDLIRNQMNAAIKDLGYDVVKSHEAGIREMSRTDYMFLDPDMVEFVEVATTHSLAGFGNMSGGEMGSTVRRRAKATREAGGGGLASRRTSATEREATIAMVSEALEVAGLDPLDDEDMKKLKEADQISFGQSTGASAQVALIDEFLKGASTRRTDGVEIYRDPTGTVAGGTIAVIGTPIEMRANVKSEGVKTVVDEMTPEEKDIIEKAVGSDRVAGLVNRIHDHWTRVSGGEDSGALLTQLSMARALGWDDEKIQREIFHAADRVEWNEEAQDFVPRDIDYAELKKKAAKVIKNLSERREDVRTDIRHREHIIRQRATGRNSGERAIVQTLALEHYYGEAYQAVLAAEQRTAAKRLKARGIETVTLYRGVVFGGSEADHLDALIGQPPQTLGADRPGSPLSSWSITEETARGFADTVSGANEPDLTGYVMKSEVSVDDIVGLSTHGFGCLPEGECIVRHGKQTVQVLDLYRG